MTCRIRPRMDEKPPSPENRPPPNSMPNRPAPRKPAASPPSRTPPGRLKKPPPTGAPVLGLPGCEKVRLNGCAVPGAVCVDGGAEKVRPPREPDENPPPTRASAEETAITAGSANAITTATAFTSPCIHCEKFMVSPQSPRQGEAPLRWAVLHKCE